VHHVPRDFVPSYRGSPSACRGTSRVINTSLH
jgi:hypothetical protein